MITVIYHPVIENPSRSNETIGNNRPEQRQVLIQEKLSDTPRFQLALNDTYTISEQDCHTAILRIHTEDFLRFIREGFQHAKQVMDTDWFDPQDEKLVPFQFFRHVRYEILMMMPLYKWAGYFGGDYVTPLYEMSYVNAMESVRNVLCAVEIVNQVHASGGVVYALNASPGHHAEKDYFQGYCFFNNGAICAQRLLDSGFKRVGILDLDYHAGNGTQEIFYERNDVVTVSIHCDPILDYPGYSGFECEKGSGEGEGFNLNIPLGQNTDLQIYQSAVGQGIQLIQNTQCDALVIAFGADTVSGDPESLIGGLGLNEPDYAYIGAQIHTELGHLPTIVTQEGGYFLAKIPDVVTNFLTGLSCTDTQ
eukprot:TRINITY_DN1524_c0_g1_i2.p1 TRINITY_DN1524_c0_g1~~TRINITY_DN1524_c0_g1_i2.p1  ORF type:complete len:388 (-),score=61.87 TRINITY_DN1524_c0_g1_i2:85-1176(-)